MTINIAELRESIAAFGSQAINEDDLNELLNRLESEEEANREWSKKTYWVQEEVQKGDLPLNYLGWHRADIIRAEVLALRAQVEGLKSSLEGMEKEVEALRVELNTAKEAAKYHALQTTEAADALALADEKIEAMEKLEPVYLFRRKDLDDFCTCSKEKYEVFSANPRLFEVKTLYALPGAQPTPSVPMDVIAAVPKKGNDGAR